MVIVENRRLLRKSIERRRFDQRISVTSNVSPALIVGDHDDDIWFFGFTGIIGEPTLGPAH